MGLPSLKVEVTTVPNMYRLIWAGFTSASQTFATGAAIVVEALAM